MIVVCPWRADSIIRRAVASGGAWECASQGGPNRSSMGPNRSSMGPSRSSMGPRPSSMGPDRPDQIVFSARPPPDERPNVRILWFSVGRRGAANPNVQNLTVSIKNSVFFSSV